MKCVKVFNNSAVSTVMPDGQEAIVLGKGIGFNRRPGSPINEELIEKIYYVQDEMQTKFLQMIQDVRPDVIEAAQQIIDMAKADGFSLSNQATISLIDHIGFAIERQRHQTVLPNLLLRETQLLYPKEYTLGQRAVELIAACCGVQLPEDEAGYIALHIVTISADRNAAYDTLKFVKGTLDIIRQCSALPLENSSSDTMRLITHLKFLAQRILQGEPWADQGDMEEMYTYLFKPQAEKPRVSQQARKLHFPELQLSFESTGKVLSADSFDEGSLILSTNGHPA